MVKRSWRRFDYLLLGALLLTSAFGLTMVYSATIDTLGVEDAVQRQAVFIGAGIFLMLVVASIDYRLLEIVQQPYAILTPGVLGLLGSALIITWKAAPVPDGQAPSILALVLSELVPVLLGWVLIILVFVADRLWLEDMEPALPRLALAATVAGAAAVGMFLLFRKLGLEMNTLLSGEASLPPTLLPFLIVGALALVYLLDCLLLRISDVLRDPIYVFMLVLLAITFTVGQVAGGSQRWLGQGQIQPSELSKILVIIVLAKLLADREGEMERFRTVLVSLGAMAVPMLLIYVQPDLGTALTLVAIWAAMIWMARIRLRHVSVLAAGVILLLPLAWFALEDYMRQRLMLFINPASDPDAYFNVHQSLVSIGSGGWTGKGLMHGTQSQLHFLRVRHTDFIFAVTAEELGFLGAVVLMGLVFFILWRILRIAARSQDTFGRLLSAGVAGMVFFQAVVNIGMNLGLMPVTGIPLPFVSYGGSSYITLMLGLGLVESVAMRHGKLEFD